ncbi:MAG: phosphoribosylformylglycinamidine cyclo-ligase [Planctomycetota bacterium]
MTSRKPLSYKEAGVDIDAKMNAIAGAKRMIERTFTPGVIGSIGGFGGLFAVPTGTAPILVASTDGVGTKVKLASRMGIHNTVGQDLVNHCVNDILVQGARPLFFLDYIALGKIEKTTIDGIIDGLTRACIDTGTALIGGETAEMPGIYQPGDFDIAGFIVGVVERQHLLDGTRVRNGDVLIGLGSSGLHTNGYSLAQKIVFERERLAADARIPGLERSIGQALLEPHRCYLKPLLPLVEADVLHAMAHITGGGFPDNVPRVIPAGLNVVIELGSWEVPPLFQWLRRAAALSQEECLRVFNMGVGMVLAVAPGDQPHILQHLRSFGLPAWPIGSVRAGAPGVQFEGEL